MNNNKKDANDTLHGHTSAIINSNQPLFLFDYIAFSRLTRLLTNIKEELLIVWTYKIISLVSVIMLINIPRFWMWLRWLFTWIVHMYVYECLSFMKTPVWKHNIYAFNDLEDYKQPTDGDVEFLRVLSWYFVVECHITYYSQSLLFESILYIISIIFF